MLPDLHIGFSRGRSGGLVFPSLSEFSILFGIHTVKGFGIVNKAERDIFLELSCFFNDPSDVGDLISGSSAFSKFYFFFKKYKFIYFNWKLITLQYCSGFAIHWYGSAAVYMCSPSWTPLHPPSLYHPSGSSQYTSPKHPVSCIKPGLVIHFLYAIIHVSMPFSQIIPPSPSPTESKRLFYTSVSLFL